MNQVLSSPAESTSLPPNDEQRENVRQGLETMIVGEVSVSCALLANHASLALQTRGDYETMFGAFRYFGTVRFRDGLVVLKRQNVRDFKISRYIDNHYGKQKNADADPHGIWVFEGYLHGQQALVGRWRAMGESADVGNLEGIFCVSRKDEKDKVLVR
jgi:hypothetical protein